MGWIQTVLNRRIERKRGDGEIIISKKCLTIVSVLTYLPTYLPTYRGSDYTACQPTMPHPMVEMPLRLVMHIIKIHLLFLANNETKKERNSL